MINYLNYLKTKPFKILWLSFIYIFCTLSDYYFVRDRDTIIQDNSYGVYIFLLLFIALLSILATYQSYKEYKDGL